MQTTISPLGNQILKQQEQIIIEDLLDDSLIETVERKWESSTVAMKLNHGRTIYIETKVTFFGHRVDRWHQTWDIVSQ
jgi:hypothetical protein